MPRREDVTQVAGFLETFFYSSDSSKLKALRRAVPDVHTNLSLNEQLVIQISPASSTQRERNNGLEYLFLSQRMTSLCLSDDTAVSLVLFCTLRIGSKPAVSPIQVQACAKMMALPHHLQNISSGPTLADYRTRLQILWNNTPSGQQTPPAWYPPAQAGTGSEMAPGP